MNGLPADADYAAGATRFAIGTVPPSRPAGRALRAASTTSTPRAAPPIAPDLEVHQRGRQLVPAARRIRRGRDHRLLRHAVLLRQRRRGRSDRTRTSSTSLGQFNYDIGSGGVYRSTDGGTTWKNLGYDLHPDYHAIAIQSDAPSHVIVGNDGGVWYSTDQRRPAPAPPTRSSAVDWQNLNGTVDPAIGRA